MPKLCAMLIVLPADAPSGLISPPAERTLSLTDKAATSAFDTALTQTARALGTRPVQVQLSGDLGTDKTMFLRTILHGLGYTGRMRSPTCTLVGPYDITGTIGTQKVYHSDPYHFVDLGEWTDTDLRDCFAEPVLCLVEWSEGAQALLGTPDLHIALPVDVVHETYGNGVEHAPHTTYLSARTQTDLQLLQSLQHPFPC